MATLRGLALVLLYIGKGPVMEGDSVWCPRTSLSKITEAESTAAQRWRGIELDIKTSYKDE